MQIRRITFQGGKAEQGLYSEDYAQDFAEFGGSEYFRKTVQLQVDLLRHLEALDGPPVWVCKSHADLVLVDQDLPAEGGKAGSVRVSPESLAYNVYCPLPESERPWERIVGYAQNVEEAGSLVLDGLRRVSGQSTSNNT